MPQHYVPSIICKSFTSCLPGKMSEECSCLAAKESAIGLVVFDTYCSASYPFTQSQDQSLHCSTGLFKGTVSTMSKNAHPANTQTHTHTRTKTKTKPEMRTYKWWQEGWSDSFIYLFLRSLNCYHVRDELLNMKASENTFIFLLDGYFNLEIVFRILHWN